MRSSAILAGATVTTAELGEILDGARRLTQDVLQPTETLFDESNDMAIARTERCVSALSTITKMGWTRLSMPHALGGVGVGRDISFLVAEEIASGSVGFAGRILLDDLVTSTVGEALIAWGTEKAKSQFKEQLVDTPAASVAWGLVPGSPEKAITLNPSGLGVNIYPSETYEPGRVSSEGNEVLVSDVRLPLVANASFCDFLLLFVDTSTNGHPLLSPYLVPVTAPGLAVEKMVPAGLRAQGFGHLVIDQLVLQPEHLLLDPAHGAEFLDDLLTRINTGVAFRAAGLATGAHRAAFGYSGTRVQGGKRIIEHGSIAESLWKTESSVAAIRELGHMSANAIARGQGDLRLAVRARTFSAETIVRVLLDLLSLFGAYGISREFAIAKMYRDACVLAVSGATVTTEGVLAHLSTF